ncbi:LacI family DNA-binding transcriptional regulator [Agaribacterium haliotis]|uniref:LacI family DNA-binding transcriptional regulator n=1 Tax=Agaribacterium haliotis TaxID=2013869 RepID=UPI000BB56761|nr:LacI family DNA-binding transcriptional regulator [Agaribacterium haliotis]
MVSIKEVARVAGVSIATVSRYINNPDLVKDATRKRVQAAIEQTEYSPNTLARNFRLGKSGIVVVVVPEIGDPFFDAVMQGINEVAKEQHYNILIRETRSESISAEEYNQMIFSKQADGIILLASSCPFNPGTQKTQQPIIVCCESVNPELSSYPSVRIDNSAAAHEATSYLIQQGHKRIAFISGDQNSLLTVDRERGYRQAMQDAGLTIEKQWLVEGKMDLDGARSATRQLLALQKRPSAIFCANDQMAMAAMHEIKQAKLRIPEDISVMGFDDIRYAEIVDPPLSTIAQPGAAIGKQSMLRLCQAIAGNNIGSDAEIVAHKLLIRHSTGPAPSV